MGFSALEWQLSAPKDRGAKSRPPSRAARPGWLLARRAFLVSLALRPRRSLLHVFRWFYLLSCAFPSLPTSDNNSVHHDTRLPAFIFVSNPIPAFDFTFFIRSLAFKI